MVAVGRTRFSSPKRIGGVLIADATVFLTADGKYTVVVVGKDGTIWATKQK
jgi:hypothetical protein